MWLAAIGGMYSLGYIRGAIEVYGVLKDYGWLCIHLLCALIAMVGCSAGIAVIAVTVAQFLRGAM